MPKGGRMKLIAAIIAIAKARLRPTEYPIHSINPVLCTRRILSSKRPGTNVIRI
jgi:hypothetical protein